MNRILLVILIFIAMNRLQAQTLEDMLEPTPRPSGLVLNTIVLHEDAATYKSGFVPKNAVESLGEKGTGKMSLYTAYVSTNNQDAGEHIQKIELYSPGKKTLVYRSGKKFKVDDVSFAKGKFQRGFLEHTVVFPQLSHAVKENFGLYVISIYIDDVWMRDFLIPVFAQ